MYNKVNNSTSISSNRILLNDSMPANSSMKIEKIQSDNRRLKKQVRKQRKELNETTEANAKFLQIIGHDLRSPLSAILGVLKLMDNSNDILTKEYVQIASDSAKRTLSLLNNLVIWASSQRVEKKIKPIDINLKELIIEELANAHENANQKEIALEYQCIDNTDIKGEPQMVKAILRNLIGNAIKYTPSGGKVFLNTSLTKRHIRVSVEDTGIGLNPWVRKNIFKRDTFFSTSGTQNEKGTGLGLLICKEFVELHGGRISARNNTGKGSKFQFTLSYGKD